MTDVETAKTLAKIGDILNIIFGSLIIVGLVISVIGIVVAPLWIFLVYWTHKRVNEFYSNIDSGNFSKAKDAILIPAILDIIFIGVVPGLLLLLAYAQVPATAPETPIETKETSEKVSQE